MTVFAFPQGSAVGGFLAQPANKYSVFHVHFFCIFPYLLPCLVSIALSVTALIAAIIFVKETHPRKLKKQQRRRASQPASGNGGSVPMEEARLIDMEDFDSGTEMDQETVGSLSSSGSIQETSFTEDEDCDIEVSHSNSSSSISEGYSIANNGRVGSENPSYRLRNGSVDQLQEAQDEGDVLLTEESPNEDSEAEMEPVQCAEKMKRRLYQKLRNVASKLCISFCCMVSILSWRWISLCREVYYTLSVKISPIWMFGE